MKTAFDKVKRRLGRKLQWPARKVRFGDLARTAPLCRNYGFSRGKPVDRLYIEQFIESKSLSIRGRVLELLNNNYTRQFGGDRVIQSDVLDINPLNAKATIHDDLRSLSSIEDKSYDCVILTQTLHLIDDDSGALRQIYRILAPGGALLLTVPCISRVPHTEEDGVWNRFYTEHGISYMLTRHFGPSEFSVIPYGNLPVATGFLYGLAVQDLDPSLFRFQDPDYPLIIGAHVTKPGNPDASSEKASPQNPA